MKSHSLGNVLSCIILHSLTGSHLPGMLWPPVGLPSCVNCTAISMARQLEGGTAWCLQITCVTCFQVIDFYIANKVFLFDLLNALLQNVQEYSDSTYVEIAFMLIFGHFVTVGTEVSSFLGVGGREQGVPQDVHY